MIIQRNGTHGLISPKESLRSCDRRRGKSAKQGRYHIESTVDEKTTTCEVEIQTDSPPTRKIVKQIASELISACPVVDKQPKKDATSVKRDTVTTFASVIRNSDAVNQLLMVNPMGTYHRNNFTKITASKTGKIGKTEELNKALHIRDSAVLLRITNIGNLNEPESELFKYFANFYNAHTPTIVWNRTDKVETALPGCMDKWQPFCSCHIGQKEITNGSHVSWVYS